MIRVISSSHRASISVDISVEVNFKEVFEARQHTWAADVEWSLPTRKVA